MFRRSVLPMIYQSELAECGLACIAMLINYHRQKCTLQSLRAKYKSGLKGSSVSQLACVAKAAGFTAEVIRLDMDQIGTLTLPAIVHWDFNHYVVLRSINKNSIVIHDPARGIRALSIVEFSRHFTGIAMELTELVYSMHHSDKVSASKKLLISHLNAHRFTLSKVILVACFLQLAYISSVKLIQYGIDAASFKYGMNLLMLVMILLGIKIVEASSSCVRQILMIRVGSRINKEFGISVMKQLMSLSPDFYMHRHTGSIYSRFTSIDKVRSALTEDLAAIVVDSIVSIITVMAMFYVNWMFASVVLAGVLISLLSSLRSSYKMREVHEEYLHNKASEITHFMENLRTMLSVKIFCKESTRLNSWVNKYSATLNSVYRASGYKISQKLIKDLICTIELSVLMFFAFTNMSRFTCSAGVLYAFLAYRSQFVNSAGSLFDKFYDFKLLRVNLDRLDDIMSEPTESTFEMIKNVPKSPNHVSSFGVKDLSFNYPRDNVVFSNISFNVSVGECVAIVGPSGCGKSTLLKVMCGLLQPTSGVLLVNNVAINSSDLKSYRKSLSAVLQEDVLLTGTVSENIHFFSEEADLDHVYWCAKRACIYDEITSLPLGFNTLIGDLGSVLSGGQKQRILLARALYARPAILFLDEASSHLDAKLERKVNQSLRELQIPIIMVAHRKETIRMADRVIDLSEFVTDVAVIINNRLLEDVV